ncbi:hypothetical protein [Nocardiopsis potens]|uniref:hypothetical protein n=1 Tax=Nocardiopsis potens TaxID=1246458 RepID=UPI00034CA80E|nr:hypothetical protein [Nocardiopsis potens]
MCISAAPAEFSGTTLYAGRLHHPEHGLVHMLGYQNSAVNLASGPNAMLLHIPARSMGRRNFISAGRHQDLLSRMVEAVKPRAVGAAAMDWMGGPQARSGVEVFEHDVYTVLLTGNAALIPAELHRVPAHKRPRIDPGLLEFYAEHYPEHTFAVCCFDNAQARRAKPLLLWYEPHDPDLLTAPALDAHTGGPPALDERVPVDHWTIFGTDEAPDGWGRPVEYPAMLRQRLRAFLPAEVIGERHTGALPNGDFALSHADLLRGDLDAVRRIGPPR